MELVNQTHLWSNSINSARPYSPAVYIAVWLHSE